MTPEQSGIHAESMESSLTPAQIDQCARDNSKLVIDLQKVVPKLITTPDTMSISPARSSTGRQTTASPESNLMKSCSPAREATCDTLADAILNALEELQSSLTKRLLQQLMTEFTLDHLERFLYGEFDNQWLCAREWVINEQEFRATVEKWLHTAIVRWVTVGAGYRQDYQKKQLTDPDVFVEIYADVTAYLRSEIRSVNAEYTPIVPRYSVVRRIMEEFSISQINRALGEFCSWEFRLECCLFTRFRTENELHDFAVDRLNAVFSSFITKCSMNPERSSKSVPELESLFYEKMVRHS